MPRPIFPESSLAHKLLDGLKGIEIGGSAHNAFNIPGCINVDYTGEMNAHKEAEVRLCGESLPVDIVAEGDHLPFPEGTWDFVLNSHVIEHMPNPLGALAEWHRVVRNGGLIYCVVPRKDDNPDDVQYEYTDIDEIYLCWMKGETVETRRCLPGQAPRGHYHFWTLESFLEMIDRFFLNSIEVVATLEKDDRCGNGFVVVLRVLKTLPATSYYRKFSYKELPNV